MEPDVHAVWKRCTVKISINVLSLSIIVSNMNINNHTALCSTVDVLYNLFFPWIMA